MKKNIFTLLAIVLSLALLYFYYNNGYYVVHKLWSKTDSVTIVLDPGHGGFDPGKIGVNKAYEKEINLSIAFKLKSLLEKKGIKVIMTREDDGGLYNKNDSDKKRTDMRNRVNVINSSNALLAVSIHQNSFSQEAIKGFQVFYYQGSEKGQMLADIIQENVKNTLKDGNHRVAKANSSYYMLRNTKCPLVIVECGFLSNKREAALLLEEAYQEKVAHGIMIGLLTYIQQDREENKVAKE